MSRDVNISCTQQGDHFNLLVLLIDGDQYHGIGTRIVLRIACIASDQQKIIYIFMVPDGSIFYIFGNRLIRRVKIFYVFLRNLVLQIVLFFLDFRIDLQRCTIAGIIRIDVDFIQIVVADYDTDDDQQQEHKNDSDHRDHRLAWLFGACRRLFSIMHIIHLIHHFRLDSIFGNIAGTKQSDVFTIFQKLKAILSYYSHFERKKQIRPEF